MQRKNHILKKDAFAMILAIAFIVVISAIISISLSFSAQTSNKTTGVFLYEQAILYSQSAAELALLNIADNGCSSSFNHSFDGVFDANVTIIGCNNEFVLPPEQNGTVTMDITITADENITGEPIRYFRRSIQKL